MKQLFLFLLSLTLCAGCVEKDYQYAVVCDFPAQYSGPNWLVVTDDARTILKKFELPTSAAHVNEKFNADVDRVTDSYNLHLVRKEDLSILSFYAVPNGAAVTFHPSQYYISGPADTYLHLTIKGVPMPEALDIPGNYSDPGRLLKYEPATQTAIINAALPGSNDCIVRLRAQGAPSFRSIYLPLNGQITDTLTVEWADFLPENDFKTLELPGNGQVEVLDVNALLPDFKRCATLIQYYSGSQPPTPLPDRVFLPGGLPLQQVSFRVRMQQNGHLIEKIFQPGEALRLEDSDLTINSAALSDQRLLEVQTSGTPDLVESILFIPSLDGKILGNWRIQGPPETYQHLVLPDFSTLLPDWLPPAPQATKIWVTAYRYDQLDYIQLVAGFPYKGGDGRLFPFARYGLQTVTKYY